MYETPALVVADTCCTNNSHCAYQLHGFSQSVVLSEARESALLHADELQYAPDGRRTETQAEQSYSIHPAYST